MDEFSFESCKRKIPLMKLIGTVFPGKKMAPLSLPHNLAEPLSSSSVNSVYRISVAIHDQMGPALDVASAEAALDGAPSVRFYDCIYHFSVFNAQDHEYIPHTRRAAAALWELRCAFAIVCFF
jgi:hypothetical protein